MRITAEASLATRERILQAATGLFATEGWDDTTTRGIAQAAGIATGTLFNYFPNKRRDRRGAGGQKRWQAPARSFAVRRNGGNSLEADLFSLIWSGAPESAWVPCIPGACLRNDLQPAGAAVSRQSRRCHPRRPFGTDAVDRHGSRLSRFFAGRDRATLLDSLPGCVRILGRGRLTRSGRHAGLVGPIAQAVCRIGVRPGKGNSWTLVHGFPR